LLNLPVADTGTKAQYPQRVSFSRICTCRTDKVYGKFYLDFEKSQNTTRNERGLYMKKRFLMLFISGIALVALIVSGLSCVGYYPGTTVDD